MCRKAKQQHQRVPAAAFVVAIVTSNTASIRDAPNTNIVVHIHTHTYSMKMRRPLVSSL